MSTDPDVLGEAIFDEWGNNDVFTNDGTILSRQEGMADGVSYPVATAIDAAVAGFTSLTWFALTLTGSPAWVNHGGGYQVAEYAKDAFGFVHLRGLIKDGVGNIGTLPAGYNPPAHNLFAVATYNGATPIHGDLNITNGGVISLTVGGNGYVQLSGITFKAA